MRSDEQYDLAAQWEFDAHVPQEMKLRRMAVDAALSNENPVYFPVTVPIMFHQREYESVLPQPALHYHRLEVSLAPGLVEHDLRVLMAEEILRRQLRKIGWKV